jgi:hypothetical protein
MRNHRTKERKEPFRCGVFGSVSGFSVTLQNNRLGWIDLALDEMVRHRPVELAALSLFRAAIAVGRLVFKPLLLLLQKTTDRFGEFEQF